jgi:hypothetical protein
MLALFGERGLGPEFRPAGSFDERLAERRGRRCRNETGRGKKAPGIIEGQLVIVMQIAGVMETPATDSSWRFGPWFLQLDSQILDGLTPNLLPETPGYPSF